MLRSSEWSLPFRISNRNFVRISHLPHARYMPRPSHPPWFDHLNNIYVEEFKLSSFSLSVFNTTCTST
jgi:hypothetical protein